MLTNAYWHKYEFLTKTALDKKFLTYSHWEWLQHQLLKTNRHFKNQLHLYYQRSDIRFQISDDGDAIIKII